MKKTVLILIAVICLQGCSSVSVDKEVDTPFGKVDVDYDNWKGTDGFSLEKNGIKLWK